MPQQNPYNERRAREGHKPRLGSETGSVMLEFVMVFPLVLTLILGAAQFGHVWLARQVVSYAAYTAARTALVAEPSEYQAAAQRAAEQVCAWVVIGQAAGENEKEIPGWGAIPGSGAVSRKTNVSIEELDDWNIKATVTFDFAMVMPIAGAVIGWAVNPLEWAERRQDATGNIHRYQDAVGYPHLRFEETIVMAKPYRTMPGDNLPTAAVYSSGFSGEKKTMKVTTKIITYRAWSLQRSRDRTGGPSSMMPQVMGPNSTEADNKP